PGDGRRGDTRIRRLEACDLEAPQDARGGGADRADDRWTHAPARPRRPAARRGAGLARATAGALGAPLRRRRRLPHGAQGGPMTEPLTEQATTLRLERTFDAPAEAVFDAWTSTDVLQRWLHPGPDWSTVRAEVDLRVGGRVGVLMREPNGDEHGGSGEYVEISRPARLVYTWTWHDDPLGLRTLVELELAEHEGRTTVVLTHSGLRDEQSREGHRDGWQKALDNLELLL